MKWQPSVWNTFFVLESWHTKFWMMLRDLSSLHTQGLNLLKDKPVEGLLFLRLELCSDGEKISFLYKVFILVMLLVIKCHQCSKTAALFSHLHICNFIKYPPYDRVAVSGHSSDHALCNPHFSLNGVLDQQTRVSRYDQSRQNSNI